MELLKMKPGIRICQWRAREELGVCVAQLIESLPFRGHQNGVFGIDEFHISVCYFKSKRKSNTNAARDLKLLRCRNQCTVSAIRNHLSFLKRQSSHCHCFTAGSCGIVASVAVGRVLSNFQG